MSASEFAAAFEEDAAGAIIQFIQGLGNMESEGRSAIAVLDDMGLSDIRMRDALLRAAGASDVFTNALQIGSNAWDENTALVNEATKRYATTQSQLTMMQNAYKNLKVAIGDAYTPALQKATPWAPRSSMRFPSSSNRIRPWSTPSPPLWVCWAP